MEFGTYVRERRWTTIAGYGLFVALMVAGYYYNITFVQLGLIDLGTRLVGMSETAVSMWMAALALVTLVVAAVTGVTMDRRGWSTPRAGTTCHGAYRRSCRPRHRYRDVAWR